VRPRLDVDQLIALDRLPPWNWCRPARIPCYVGTR